MDANLGIEFLNSFSNVPQETINQLMSISKLKEVKPGKQIVKLNEVPTKIFMLASGVARCYITTENGKEFNKNFFLPYSFIAPLTALVKSKPSSFIFETLSDCQIYEVDYYKISDLCSKDMFVNTLYSKVLESVYMTYEKRLVELISLDAKERYLELKKQIPNVDEIIPQYHIASYLGITPVQLSRIRKKIDDD